MEGFRGRIRMQRTKNLRKSIVWSQGLEFRQILSTCVIYSIKLENLEFLVIILYNFLLPQTISFRFGLYINHIKIVFRKLAKPVVIFFSIEELYSIRRQALENL